MMRRKLCSSRLAVLTSAAALICAAVPVRAAHQRPNAVVLVTDDTGWADFGVQLVGAVLGHPTPTIDRVAKEGAIFTSWYGQATRTADRASFMTRRIPIRSALSVVVVPGDKNGLRRETLTIAEFYQGAPLVPEIQRRILEAVSGSRESVRVVRHGGQA